MEVLQDTYKDTKIGRIPKNWEVLKLGDIFTFKNGLNKAKEFFGYGIPIVNYMDVYSNEGVYLKDLKGRVHLTSNEIDRFNIKKGDVFFTRTSETKEEIGYATVLLEDIKDGVFSGFVLRARSESNKLNLLFKKYCFSSNIARKQIYAKSTISTRALTNGGSLSLVTIPLPPLPEQQKIAAILSTVDEQISTTDNIIEKSKELKKGLIQRFFLNKAYMIMSLGEAEKTELMPIKFKALGKILTGTTPPTANKEYYDTEDYMFIGPADLGKVKDVKSSKKYISVKGFDVTRKLPENALMVVCIGATIGKIGLTTEPCATNQQVNTIVPKDEYSARYLYYVICGLKKYLLGFAGDTATPQLNKTDFGKVVTFIHKSKSERTKIATILSEADAKIEKEQEQKTQLEQLKKGLMQQLLTGKKRVKV